MGVAGDLGDDGLFAVDPAQRAVSDSVAAKPPVDKTFRVFDPGQGLLLPPSLDDWLPAEHLARFIAELVDEHLDLSRIRAGYTDGRGAPPYDPRLMVRILLYGYSIGVRSSRAIEVKCTDDVPFRWLAAGAAPDYRAIARFRKRHLSALGHLFVQASVWSRRGGGCRGSGRRQCAPGCHDCRAASDGAQVRPIRSSGAVRCTVLPLAFNLPDPPGSAFGSVASRSVPGGEDHGDVGVLVGVVAGADPVVAIGDLQRASGHEVAADCQDR